MKWFYLAAMVSLLLLSTCGVKKVDQRFDFSAIETYAWLEPDPTTDRLYRNLKPVQVKWFQKTTDQVLKNKGLVKDEQSPNVYVLCYMEAGKGVKTRSISGKPILGVGDVGISTSESAGFIKGALVLEIYDANDGLIWQGRVKVNANQETARGKREITDILEKMLTKFPFK